MSKRPTKAKGAAVVAPKDSGPVAPGEFYSKSIGAVVRVGSTLRAEELLQFVHDQAIYLAKLPQRRQKAAGGRARGESLTTELRSRDEGICLAAARLIANGRDPSSVAGTIAEQAGLSQSQVRRILRKARTN